MYNRFSVIGNAISYYLEQGSKKEKNIMAKNMIKKGVEIEFIKEITGLTDKEIEELRKNEK